MLRRATIALLSACCLLLPAAASASGPPAIVDGTPDHVRNFEATLHFSIDPEGLATTYYVEYGTTAGYGQRAGLYDETVPAGDDPVARTELLSVWGLAPATTYHYRVVATNGAGTTYGDDQELTTTDEPAPVVVTAAAGNETESSVVLHGTVDPEGLPVTVCRFHYVTHEQFERFGFTTSFGPRPTPMGVLVPCAESAAEIGSGDEPVPVHAVVEGFPPGRHHFRLEAENAFTEAIPGAASGFGQAPPRIEYLAPSPLRNRTATLRFAVDPEGLETEYEVEYGRGEGEYFEYHYLWDRTLPAGDQLVPGKADLPAYWEGGLVPDTEYHWRVVARNAAGTTEGPDETFVTPDEPAPVLVNVAATPLGEDGASFSGTVDPEGSPLTGCRFRWVSDSTYAIKGFEGWAATEMVSFGETVPCEEGLEAIGSGSDPVAVHAEISGLEPGLYYVRVEAENAYEDGAAWPGLPISIGTSGEESDEGCSPSCGSQAVLTPPAGTASQNSAPQRHAKPLRKKHRKKLRRNATIRARR